MIVLVAFAFLAGIVTILSPCILPILPIVLSGSFGGRSRPFGIVIGFIASFTFFTLFLSAIVRATGIPADSLRSISIVLIFAFGVALLIPQTQIILESLFQRISSGQQPNSRTGFFGGIVIGFSLGLLWTPCVGPILASVISLAITGSVSGSAFFITLAYAAGTGIPMLLIMNGGQKMLSRMPFLTKNTGKIQKIFGVVMILTAALIFFNIDRKFQAYIIDRFPQYGAGLTKLEQNDAVEKQLKDLTNPDPERKLSLFESIDSAVHQEAPEFIAGGEWLNSEPITMKSLRGKVVLVDFWTYTCINCIRTLPYLREWHTKYAESGLVIVGVHTPEFEFEKITANVQKAAEDFSLKYPIVQDNDYATWRAYNNRYWPAKYLIDRNGKIRYTHFGEGDYDETEQMIQKLLREAGAAVNQPIDNPDYDVYSRTPETYLGYERVELFASDERIEKDGSATYSFQENPPLHRFALSGVWNIGREYAKAVSGAALTSHFEAKEVYLVMRPGATPGNVEVLLDGEKVSSELAGADVSDGQIYIDTDRLYHLISLPQPGQHILELRFDGEIEAYAFTFG